MGAVVATHRHFKAAWLGSTPSALAILMLAAFLFVPIVARPVTLAQNQIYVLCAASVGYQAMLEKKTGEGPRYRRLVKIGAAYTDLVDVQFVAAITQVLTKMLRGEIAVSDINGTATNCIRWYEQGEIEEI